ncbi:hypothetical protein PG990_001991 [Apiospora arundinis]
MNSLALRLIETYPEFAIFEKMVLGFCPVLLPGCGGNLGLGGVFILSSLDFVASGLLVGADCNALLIVQVHLHLYTLVHDLLLGHANLLEGSDHEELHIPDQGLVRLAKISVVETNHKEDRFRLCNELLRICFFLFELIDKLLEAISPEVQIGDIGRQVYATGGNLLDSRGLILALREFLREGVNSLVDMLVRCVFVRSHDVLAMWKMEERRERSAQA